MKQYKDLDLKTIRDKFDLDFAHYTYKPGMCSCCYGPTDLPKRYWKNGIIKIKDYTYLLFNNADNGSGHVTKNDEIDSYTCIRWSFPLEKLNNICNELMNQLGDEYYVWMPKDKISCIIITTIDDIQENSRLNINKNFTCLSIK